MGCKTSTNLTGSYLWQALFWLVMPEACQMSTHTHTDSYCNFTHTQTQMPFCTTAIFIFIELLCLFSCLYNTALFIQEIFNHPLLSSLLRNANARYIYIYRNAFYLYETKQIIRAIETVWAKVCTICTKWDQRQPSRSLKRGDDQWDTIKELHPFMPFKGIVKAK